MKIEEAIEVLKEELIKDKEPGSYYYEWQSNIACTIMDNSDIERDQADNIAEKFLKLLTSYLIT